MQNKLTVFIPVETKARELPYKSPLSYILVELGFKVIIGRQQELRLSWFKRRNFIYIDKSAARTKLNLFRDIKKYGGGLGVFCEEGLLYKSKAQYISERIHEKCFRLIDIFWCWGPKQYRDISENFDQKKLKVINSPRLAIAYKNRNSKRNKSKNKKCKILFLTSFGRISRKLNLQQKTYLDILKERGTFNSKLGEKYYKDWDNYYRNYKNSFIKMINELCNTFSNISFLIRIHPTESKADYEQIVSENKNLKFSNYNSLVDSIINSYYVISTYSTSALEAKLMNKNSIVFAPLSDERFDPIIIKDLCNCYSSIDEITSIIKDKKSLNFSNQNFSNYLESSIGNEFEILLSYAKEIIQQSKYIKTYNGPLHLFIKIKYFLKFYLRELIYKLKIKEDTINAISKCKDLSSEDIINYSEEFFSGNNKFSNIKQNYLVKKLSNNVFEISKN
ncbi:hypothetical protein OA189_01740 [Prochlorococcus sp. AH-716-P20]|nr:hypothetical protein [Prochlorococcus sp. AH-716-P20]